MARFRMMRRRRPRRRFVWTGFQFGDSPSGTNGIVIPDGENAPTNHIVIVIAGPPTAGLIGEPLNTQGDLLVHRVLFSFTIDNTNIAVDAILNMSLEVVPTDLAEVPFTFKPDFSDPDALHKRGPMWTGAWYVPVESSVGMSVGVTTVGTQLILNEALPFDVNVKRKLRGDEALVMKLTSLSTVGETPSSLNIRHWWCRALISAGRR